MPLEVSPTTSQCLDFIVLSLKLNGILTIMETPQIEELTNTERMTNHRTKSKTNTEAGLMSPSIPLEVSPTTGQCLDFIVLSEKLKGILTMMETPQIEK